MSEVDKYVYSSDMVVRDVKIKVDVLLLECKVLLTVRKNFF